MTTTGPLWQMIVPGERVRPKRRRKLGEVVAVLDETAAGVPKHVLVCWDADPRCRTPQMHATDCLEPAAPKPAAPNDQRTER